MGRGASTPRACPVKPKRPQPIKIAPYTATARRDRTEGGVVEWYWTARCRRKGMEGEWVLGWFPSRRQAEQAFTKWASARNARPRRRGSVTMGELLDAYELAVPRMTSKREQTRWNRRYTAAQLREFLDARYPELLADAFDEFRFEEYLGWLQNKDYKPQTIENALVGARTLLKWAEASKWLHRAPPRPAFRVPPSEPRRINGDDYSRVLTASSQTDEPVRLPLLLRLLWESGMRPSEAFGIPRRHLDVKEAVIRLREHGQHTLKTSHSNRVVPVSDDLIHQLAELPEQADGTLFGVPQVDRTYHYWRHRLQLSIRAAEVDDFTLGDFRNTRSTRLLNAGTPLHVYGRMMGHSPKTALKHYAAVSDRDLRAAFERARLMDVEEGDGHEE